MQRVIANLSFSLTPAGSVVPAHENVHYRVDTIFDTYLLSHLNLEGGGSNPTNHSIQLKIGTPLAPS